MRYDKGRSSLPLSLFQPRRKRLLVVTRVRSTTTKCTRGRGCNGHPAFPTPSLGGRFINASGALRGEDEVVSAETSSFRDAPLGAGPESILPAGVMDSGLALRAPRNDGVSIAPLRMFLPQQHRVRAVHRFGAVHDRPLQRGRLHRDVFGKEPRQRNVALRVAGAFAEIGRASCRERVFGYV